MPTFSQKYWKSKSQDPPFAHLQTIFLLPTTIATMEAKVSEAWGPIQTKTKPPSRQGNVSADMIDDVETWTTWVPNSVLDGSERALIAVQEGVAKASKEFYADMGVMALLCHHDQSLWIINLTTPGERQYYALALLECLFTHLPPDWNVGLLYDVDFQVHCSVIKVSHFYTLCYLMAPDGTLAYVTPPFQWSFVLCGLCLLHLWPSMALPVGLPSSKV